MSPKILCVDDDVSFLETLGTLLSPNGYEVIKAPNCEDALERLNQEKIDLVVLDANMPKLDGFELCRIIKTDENYMNIPVILTADSMQREDRIRGIEAGVEDFISKPIDPVEILERIKTLLNAKQPNERRLGELLIDMNFINEAELGEALRLSKERKIKVGEALISMGALDKDHIYWALSNQLKMNYIEISYEMIDTNLVREFSIATLEELQCLPLYETTGETHFAIADPTNQLALRAIRELNPLKRIRLHLALPEKIMKILGIIKQELPSASPAIGATETLLAPPAPLTEKPHGESAGEKPWDILTEALLSLSPKEGCWLYRDSKECSLILQHGDEFRTAHHFSGPDFSIIQQRLDKKITNKNAKGLGHLLIQQKASNVQELFKIWPLVSLNNDLYQIRRVPVFSPEDLSVEHPHFQALLRGLQYHFTENGRLLIGGKESLMIKQCCYSLAKIQGYLAQFPPAFFVEEEVEVYFPGAAQVSNYQFQLQNLLDYFRDGPAPFILYETSMVEISRDILKIIAGHYRHIILYVPFPSFESMNEALLMCPHWPEAGMKAVFIQGTLQEIR